MLILEIKRFVKRRPSGTGAKDDECMSKNELGSRCQAFHYHKHRLHQNVAF